MIRKMMLLKALDKDVTVSLNELKEEWQEMFELLFSQDHTYTLKSFLKEDYYDDDDYLLNVETEQCVKANDYFHKYAPQLVH